MTFRQNSLSLQFNILLDYIPARFTVIRHVRPALSCRCCEGMVQAPMPTLPIERGLPSAGLLAPVLIAKYCDHLPLYRQSAIYAREGVDLERSLLASRASHGLRERRCCTATRPIAKQSLRNGSWPAFAGTCMPLAQDTALC